MLALERIVFARIRAAGETVVRPVLVCRHACYALYHGAIVFVEEASDHDRSWPSYVVRGIADLHALDQAVRHALEAADELLVSDERLSAAESCEGA